MKNRIHTNLLMNWLMSAVLLIAATGCSEKNEDVVTPTDVNEVKTRHLVITQVEDNTATKSALTRAILTENGSTMTASWKAGDALTYCNLDQTKAELSQLVTGPLTATQTAAFSQFSGSVTCALSDDIAVVYPTTTFTAAKTFTINLADQTGDLDDVANSFHYVYGVATVTAVTANTATASMGLMKSLLTLCKFSFTDGSAAIPINTLEISYDDTYPNDSRGGKYPHSATVAAMDDTAVKSKDDVHATATNFSGPLTISASGRTEVYVAMVPTSESVVYRFTVTNSLGTYTGTATARLKEGEFVVATDLRLTKQQ